MSITALDAMYSTGSVMNQQPNSLGKDAFLNLLVTQLQYQDPLAPMGSTEFTAQLAQFSSLEQLNNVNENLEYLQLYQASLNNSQAVGFIGKRITATGDAISLADGESDDIRFNLAGDADSIMIKIFDTDGTLVKNYDVGSVEAGENNIEWDGTDNNDNNMPDGEYSFEIIATDVDGRQVDVTTFTSGKVTGVTFVNSVAYLLVGGMKIPLNTVVEVNESI